MVPVDLDWADNDPDWEDDCLGWPVEVDTGAGAEGRRTGLVLAFSLEG